MTEPKRWLEGGDAGDDALALLRAARPPVPLGAAARLRSTQRVAAFGVPPVAAAFGWWPALALGVVLGVGGSVAVTGLVASAPPPSATSSARRAPSSHSATAPLVEAPSLEQQPSEAASLPEHAAPKPAPTAPPAAPLAAPPVSESDSVDVLQQEIRLLEQARRNLAASPGTARLVLLDHEQRFPSGHLRVERELLLVDALVRLGRRPEAEARATSLERQNPNSLYGERLEQILGKRPK
jgi:hypothetical protein